jgi:TATA-box binding protein (TBP) (component of TFIID and TFIIIB)
MSTIMPVILDEAAVEEQIRATSIQVFVWNFMFKGIIVNAAGKPLYVHLKKLAEARNTSFNSRDQVKAVAMQLPGSPGKIRVFNTGSFTGTGVCTHAEVRDMAASILKLSRNMHVCYTTKDLRVQEQPVAVKVQITNIVASFQLNVEGVQLDQMSTAFSGRGYVKYDPEGHSAFPALIFDMTRVLQQKKAPGIVGARGKATTKQNGEYQNIKALVFTKGKVVVVGSQDIYSMYRGCLYIQEVAQEFAKGSTMLLARGGLLSPTELLSHASQNNKSNDKAAAQLQEQAVEDPVAPTVATDVDAQEEDEREAKRARLKSVDDIFYAGLSSAIDDDGGVSTGLFHAGGLPMHTPACPLNY